MLGYRSHFTVAGVTDNQPLTAAALAQANSWLRWKKYDADAVELGQTRSVSENAEVTLTEVRAQDDSVSTMFLLQERSGDAVWTSRLIIHEPAHDRRDPWVWLDIVSPDDAPFTARPRLTQYLLEVLDGRDGGSRLDPQVRHTGVEDIPELVDALRDPRRRGLVFVAGSDDSLPIQPWRRLVGDLLHETTGLAAGYVLDADATREFAMRVGESHAVPAGTMRTYVRGVELGNPLDARRHRYLGTAQIVNGKVGNVRRVLGARAREIALAQPLSSQAIRVENSLLEQADRDFFSARKVVSLAATSRSARTMPADTSETTTLVRDIAVPATPEPVAPDVPPAPLPGVNDRSTTAHVEDVEVHLALVNALTSILGTSEVSVEAIERLRETASEAVALQAAVDRKTVQYEQVSASLATLREQRAEDRKRLEDEQLEHAETYELLERERATVKALRNRLSADGRAEDAWRDVAPSEASTPNLSGFADLLEQMCTLDALVWTGDEKITIDLDVHDPLARWAGKTWEILLALQDYANERVAERALNVDHYLNHTPPHLHGYSANRHAVDESKSVRANAKHSAARMLRVPKHVDASGRIFMGAHFKIAQSGLISPRMHYLDNVHRDGKIYIGYIGPHLPTDQTN